MKKPVVLGLSILLFASAAQPAFAWKSWYRPYRPPVNYAAIQQQQYQAWLNQQAELERQRQAELQRQQQAAAQQRAAVAAREQQAVAAAVSACSGTGASSDACVKALATVLALGLSNPALLQNKQIGQLVAKVSPAKLQAAVATVVAQITGQKIDVKQVTAIIDTSRTAGSAA